MSGYLVFALVVVPMLLLIVVLVPTSATGVGQYRGMITALVLTGTSLLLLGSTPEVGSRVRAIQDKLHSGWLQVKGEYAIDEAQPGSSDITFLKGADGKTVMEVVYGPPFGGWELRMQPKGEKATVVGDKVTFDATPRELILYYKDKDSKRISGGLLVSNIDINAGTFDARAVSIRKKN